jgi:hypothetical protein
VPELAHKTHDDRCRGLGRVDEFDTHAARHNVLNYIVDARVNDKSAQHH